jgi:hypothetical protein
LSASRAFKVWRLWIRSASLMKMTRISSVIARMILRMASARRASADEAWTRLIFVTPFDEVGDLPAEVLPDLGDRHVRVLQDVVEQGGRKGRPVETHVGQVSW